jgi:glycosyltransferase involved in cell wall biosynthesis
MLISVILTTYNSGEQLNRTLNSILNQEGVGQLFEIEIIAVDDCSTDGTWERLLKYPIKAFQSDRNTGGPNYGRNVGLKNMNGDWFNIVDHDDIWQSNRIKSLLPHFHKAPIITSSFTIHYTQYLKNSLRGTGQTMLYEENKTFKKKLSRDRSGQNTYLGAIFAQSELKNILFETEYGRIDYDWVLRIFYQRSSFEVGESLYQRIVDGSNLSMDRQYRSMDFNFSLELFKLYEKEFPNEVRSGRLNLFSSKGKYHYVMGETAEARYYFLRGRKSLLNFLYFMTTFFGRSWVVKRFTIFG